MIQHVSTKMLLFLFPQFAVESFHFLHIHLSTVYLPDFPNSCKWSVGDDFNVDNSISLASFAISFHAALKPWVENSIAWTFTGNGSAKSAEVETIAGIWIRNEAEVVSTASLSRWR
jgi:hypothetical protein